MEKSIPCLFGMIASQGLVHESQVIRKAMSLGSEVPAYQLWDLGQVPSKKANVRKCNLSVSKVQSSIQMGENSSNWLGKTIWEALTLTDKRQDLVMRHVNELSFHCNQKSWLLLFMTSQLLNTFSQMEPFFSSLFRVCVCPKRLLASACPWDVKGERAYWFRLGWHGILAGKAGRLEQEAACRSRRLLVSLCLQSGRTEVFSGFCLSGYSVWDPRSWDGATHSHGRSLFCQIILSRDIFTCRLTQSCASLMTGVFLFPNFWDWVSYISSWLELVEICLSASGELRLEAVLHHRRHFRCFLNQSS